LERLRSVITPKDIYWLSGLLEGEGNFSHERCRGQSPRIVLRMTDEDVVRSAFHLMGYRGSVRSYKPKNNRKPAWEFSLTGNRAAGWMMTLYPWMGLRRKGRIREILEIWHKHRHRPITPMFGLHSKSREYGRLYSRLWRKRKREEG